MLLSSKMVDFFFNLPLVVRGLRQGRRGDRRAFPAGGRVLDGRAQGLRVDAGVAPVRNRAISCRGSRGFRFVGKFLQHLGVFHLMADGAKFLFWARSRVPGHVNKLYFILAPAIAMMPALTTVTVVPVGAYFDAAGHVIRARARRRRCWPARGLRPAFRRSAFTR